MISGIRVLYATPVISALEMALWDIVGQGG